MRLIIFLAIVISAAGYVGLAPGFSTIAGMPATFFVGALLTVSVIYVLAKV